MINKEHQCIVNQQTYRPLKEVRISVLTSFPVRDGTPGVCVENLCPLHGRCDGKGVFQYSQNIGQSGLIFVPDQREEPLEKI
ncbi:MAG: hypothetical protein UT24_C0008G0012 [Candidatus Woesebacteria bacterium GW2011_GWB1_39_12]|uniref:Uncharacterized protein n=2 Tax=Candidatus Woeseibacteriota TaxID=1752722 RepID=A0A0G0LZX4_9BACT|nr:MAG: hypothetical protein UT23_C0012G0088 [Candidatus Woesebacteria bacterium GW2011_GWA1_39_12]KKR00884.1 MAG: hypothetical protein UT24_C0008G0012 [Candidatus Woesebacteria bacterium GW2011_GWB1_39_12]